MDIYMKASFFYLGKLVATYLYRRPHAIRVNSTFEKLQDWSSAHEARSVSLSLRMDGSLSMFFFLMDTNEKVLLVILKLTWQLALGKAGLWKMGFVRCELLVFVVVHGCVCFFCEKWLEKYV